MSCKLASSKTQNGGPSARHLWVVLCRSRFSPLLGVVLFFPRGSSVFHGKAHLQVLQAPQVAVLAESLRCRKVRDAWGLADETRATRIRMHYTPEHCLVNSGVPLLWWKSHVSIGQHVSFKEPCASNFGLTTSFCFPVKGAM